MNDNQNPYNTPSSPVGETTADIQIPIFKSWFLFIVFATLGELAVGFAVPPIAGIVPAVFGLPLQSRATIMQIIVLICTLPVSYIAYRWTINNIILERLLRKLPGGHKINGRSMGANGVRLD